MKLKQMFVGLLSVILGTYRVGNIDIPEVNEYRIEIDRLWDSLEAVFAMAMWNPSSLPKIRTSVDEISIQVDASYAVCYDFCFM